MINITYLSIFHSRYVVLLTGVSLTFDKKSQTDNIFRVRKDSTFMQLQWEPTAVTQSSPTRRNIRSSWEQTTILRCGYYSFLVSNLWYLHIYTYLPWCVRAKNMAELKNTFVWKYCVRCWKKESIYYLLNNEGRLRDNLTSRTFKKSKANIHTCCPRTKKL